jgi:hypothetical protein
MNKYTPLGCIFFLQMKYPRKSIATTSTDTPIETALTIVPFLDGFVL